MGGAPGGGKQENSCGALSRGGALGPRALVVSGAFAHPGRPVSELEFSNSSISEINESSRTGHLISLSFTFQLLGVLSMTLLLLF